MQVGVAYPQPELRGDPAAVRRYGTAVEALGYGHISAYDHVVGAVHADRTPPLAGPLTERDPFHDPFVMLAHLAALTERIELTTGVLVLPQRQTALVARQAADVDLFSGGRLRLGVGIGWNHVEYSSLGQDFGTRGARQEEQIELLRRLFTEPVVDFAGHFDQVDRAALVPKPTRSIPIWMGGASEAAYARAARLADGFLFFGWLGIDQAVEAWEQMQERVQGHGRAVEDFGVDYIALQQGGIESLTAQFNTWSEAGGTHFTVDIQGLGLETVDEHIEHLASVATALRLS